MERANHQQKPFTRGTAKWKNEGGGDSDTSVTICTGMNFHFMASNMLTHAHIHTYCSVSWFRWNIRTWRSSVDYFSTFCLSYCEINVAFFTLALRIFMLVKCPLCIIGLLMFLLARKALQVLRWVLMGPLGPTTMITNRDRMIGMTFWSDEA